MRIATIDVPKGCTKIFVELEDGKLIVTYGSTINSKEFFCKETGHMEEVPGVGDFAVMWIEGERALAIVANVHGLGKSGKFHGADGCRYDHAIKFRNYEQYLKIKGEYAEKDEP